MAILSDSSPAVSLESDVWQQRVESLEQEVTELVYRLEQLSVDSTMSSIRQQSLEKMIVSSRSLDDRTTAWRERLVFRFPEIHSSQVWRGQILPVYRNVVSELERELKETSNGQDAWYFGATYNPERRLGEHGRSLTLFDKSTGKKENLSMDILYHTTRLEKAADLESRLLSRFPASRNTTVSSHGLGFGKPSYFVYLLRFTKRTVK